MYNEYFAPLINSMKMYMMAYKMMLGKKQKSFLHDQSPNY